MNQQLQTRIKEITDNLQRGTNRTAHPKGAAFVALREVEMGGRSKSLSRRLARRQSRRSCTHRDMSSKYAALGMHAYDETGQCVRCPKINHNKRRRYIQRTLDLNKTTV